MRNVSRSFVILAVVAISTPLFAQQTTIQVKENDNAADKSDRRTTDKATTERRGDNDEQLAAVILACARSEVQIAKFAIPLLNSNDAKQFAERLAKDHQAQVDKLEKLAGQYHPHNSAVATEHKAKLEFGRLKLEASGGTNPTQNANATAPTAAPLDWVQIQQQIAKECAASAQAELQRHEGKHFDECFIGMQIAAHMKMVDQLKVYQTYASTNLRGQIDGGLETAQSHLKEAKAIMESQTRSADKAATSSK